MTLTLTKPKQILVVEDDQEMIELYKDMFDGRQDSYKVEFESNSVYALQKAMKNDHDLIILDIIMEYLSGDAFYARLREEKNTPVLMVTVLNPNTLDNLKKLNNFEVLRKPVTKEQLFGQIEKMLN